MKVMLKHSGELILFIDLLDYTYLCI